MDRVFNLAGSIITLAMVTVVLSDAGGTATVFRSVGELFSSTLGTAMGRFAR